MSSERDQLISEIPAMLGDRQSEGIAFLRSEKWATEYTEYTADILPTFLQTHDLARIYMQTNCPDISAEQLDFGLGVRNIRATEAQERKNTLYFTEASLAMDSILNLSDMSYRPLKVTVEQRAKQMARITLLATKPYLNLRLLPAGTELPDFPTLIMMKFPEGDKTAFQEVDQGISPPIFDPDKLDHFSAAVDKLSATALSNSETIEYLSRLRNL